jgi:hypothetical protein
MLYSYDWGFSISRIVASTNPTSSQILSTYDGKKSYVSLNATGFTCIRVLTCDEDYVVEGGSIIFTVDDNINITYIKDITDISTLSVGFVQVLIVHLAGIMLYSSLQLFWYEFISVLASASLDIKPPLKDNIFLRTLSPFYYKSVITLPLI